MTLRAGDDECQLICIAIGYSFRYDFGHVIDGTRCERGDGDFVCVEGECLVSSVVSAFNPTTQYDTIRNIITCAQQTTCSQLGLLRQTKQKTNKRSK